MFFKSDKQRHSFSYPNTSRPQPVEQNPDASQPTLQLQQPVMQNEYGSLSTLSFYQPILQSQYQWESTYSLQQQSYSPVASSTALAYGSVGDLTKPPQEQGYLTSFPNIGPVYSEHLTSPPPPLYPPPPVPVITQEYVPTPQQQIYTPPIPPKIHEHGRKGRSASVSRYTTYGGTPESFPEQHHSHTFPVSQPYGSDSIPTISSPPKHGSKNRLRSSTNKAERLASKSCVDLRGQLTAGTEKSMNMLKATTIDKPQAMISKSTQVLNQGAALCDLMSTKLDTVLTSIDGEYFGGGKVPDLKGYNTSRRRASSGNESFSSSSEEKSNHFSKVWLYANSRLPPHLPPFKVYIPTFPLMCLAANYSESVYTPPAPRSSGVDTHIPADWRSGTKAMVLKAIPIDDMNTIVFAIRGTQTFMDWAVNYKSSPASPKGFLDDEGNLCHAGFLDVAKKMVKPVADRLKTLLEENPSRSHCSLLITGHSAGGAVASLLYAHMMSEIVSSDLSYLTSFFKRVHCVTFGAPPVSLLPLKRSENVRHRKSLFFSFINEGDPVPRADKQVILSLVKLYVTAAPSTVYNSTLSSMSSLQLSSTNTSSSLDTTTSSKPNKSKKSKKPKEPKSLLTAALPFSKVMPPPTWAIPPCTMCVAGRLVVLRQRPDGKGEDDVEAVTVDEEILREVVYGDPEKHMMTLYKSRVERLAVRAVTADL